MIRLETERLFIQPLTFEQVQKFIRLGDELEDELGLGHNNRTISKELFNGITNYTLPGLEKHADQNLFYTIWLLILKKENVIAGDLSFKGAPTDSGEIEIGYGTHPDYRNNGYMKEAVSEMIKWAAQQNSVNTILAETRSDNLPSIVILKKNGFSFLRDNAGMFWWYLDLRS